MPFRTGLFVLIAEVRISAGERSSGQRRLRAGRSAGDGGFAAPLGFLEAGVVAAGEHEGVMRLISSPNCLTGVASISNLFAGASNARRGFPGKQQGRSPRFPREAMREAGYAIELAQDGRRHPDAVPMKGFGGASVLEVRISDDGDAYRAVYTVAFAEVVYVLHCFQKKAKSGIVTPQRDLDVIAQRLKLARADYERQHQGA